MRSGRKYYRGATRFRSLGFLMYLLYIDVLTVVCRRRLHSKFAFGPPSKVHSQNTRTPHSHRQRLSCDRHSQATTLSQRLCKDYTTIFWFCQVFFYRFQYFLSSERYIIASAICSARISSDSSRSAIVLATRSTLSCPRAESPRLSNA